MIFCGHLPFPGQIAGLEGAWASWPLQFAAARCQAHSFASPFVDQEAPVALLFRMATAIC